MRLKTHTYPLLQDTRANGVEASPETCALFRRVATLCGLFIITLSVFTLFSWIKGLSIFTSILQDYASMEPSSAMCFILLGQVLIFCSTLRLRRVSRYAAFAEALCVLAVSLTILLEFSFENAGYHFWRIENIFSSLYVSGTFTRMSPLAAVNFLLASSGLLLLQMMSQRYHHRVGDLALTAIGLSLVVLLGYLYGTPLFYGGPVVPMSLTSAISFIIFGFGLIAAVGPHHFPAVLFIGPSVRARLLRVLLPTTLVFTTLYTFIYKELLVSTIVHSLFISTLVFMVLIGVTVSLLIHTIGGRIDRAGVEHRKAEEAMLHLAAIVESSKDGIIGTRFDGTILSWNKGAETIFEKSENEMLDTSLLGIFPKTANCDLTSLFDTVRKGESVALTEYETVRTRDKKREPIYLLFSISPVIDSVDRVVSASVIVRDITEQKKSERKVRDNLVRLSTLIEHLPVAVLIEDEAEHILNVSGKFCTLFGIAESPLSFAGHPSAEILDLCKRFLTHSEEFDTCRTQQLQNRKPMFSQEFMMQDDRILECDYLPVIVDGTYSGSLWQFRDSTERRRAEKAKSDFVLLASHQLRTPLTAMSLTFETLQGELLGTLNDRQKALVQQGQTFGTHMADTIRSILSVSRIEAGKITPSFTSVNLLHLAATVITSYRMEAVRKQQMLTLSCSTNLTFDTDANLLREILYSLVSNAVNYTPVGGKIHVGVRQENGHIIIQVEDSGYGIPLKEQDRVFQKFFRAENAIHKQPDGTGIGLYLTHSFVAILGGTITFQSVENQGTTFTISLPVSPHA